MKSVLASLFTLMVLIAFAGPTRETAMRVLSVDANEYKLVYSSTVIEQVSVKILDYENRVVYQQNVGKTNGFVLPLNFRKAGNGNFTVLVITPEETLKERVVLRRSFVPVEKTIGFDKLDDSVVKITSAMDNEDPVRMVIKNAELRTIFSESLSSGNFSKTYRFENLKEGLVEFYLFQNGRLIERKLLSL